MVEFSSPNPPNHGPSEPARGTQPGSEVLQRQFLRHRRAIYAHIRGLVPPYVDPEEIFQDTFMVVMNKAGQYRPDAPALPWILGIARMEVLKHIRDLRRKNERAFSPELVELLAESEQDTEPYEQTVLALRQCIDRLPPMAHRLLNLFYFKGFTAKAIAEQLSIAPRSVYTSLNRTRLRLRECVKHALSSE